MKTTLLGLDLAPLPGESLYGLLARIAWLNVLTPNQLRKLVGVSSQHVPLIPTYLSAGTLARVVRNVAQMTGWAPDSLFPKGVSALDLTEWFEYDLVVCPTCAAGFYHSHWHQLRGMRRCPVHDCELVRHCVTCGHPFGRYALNKELFSQPYRCAACGAPLGGGELLLRDMIAFREAHQNLAQVFGPWRRWSRGVMARLGRMGAGTHGLDLLNVSRWWSFEQLTTAITHHFHSCPPGCTVPQTELTWLVWTTHPPSAYYNGHQISEVSRWNQNTQTYRVLLRELQQWILSTTVLPTLSHTPVLLDEKGCLKREGWETSALAYMLLRRNWEHGIEWSPAAPVDRARIAESFHYSRGLPYSREHDELMVRALTLAIFSAYYWMISRTDKFEPRELYINDSVAVFKNSKYTKPPFAVIIFPTIPGLPLNGFSPPRLKLEDAWELYRQAQKMEHVRSKFEWRDGLHLFRGRFCRHQIEATRSENPHSSP